MSTCDGAADATNKMVLHAQKLSGKKIITIRPDGTIELKFGAAKRFLEENGTIIDDVPPYSPQSNSRAERCNRTILEKARTIIAQLKYNVQDGWAQEIMARGSAMRGACAQSYVYEKYAQRCPTRDSVRSNGRKKSDLSHLRIFGTKAMVLKPKKYRKSKMDAKTWTGIHVRYAPGDANRCYIPELKRVFISEGVTFIEKLYKKENKTKFEIPTCSHDNSSEMVDMSIVDDNASDDGGSNQHDEDKENF